MRYPINEIFQTIQGEGFHSGTPSLFIRFQGCPVACSWCDTKHSWMVDPKQQGPLYSILDKQESDQRWAQVGVAEIIDLICTRSYSAKHVVITGGEPCMHDLTPLTTHLEQLDYLCQIETSGTYKVLCSEQTWVTVSPKVGMKGGMEICQQALKRADEIKHPVARERDIENLLLLLGQIQFAKKPIIALQPVSQNRRATEICIKACMLHNWQLSVQLHKYLGIS